MTQKNLPKRVMKGDAKGEPLVGSGAPRVGPATLSNCGDLLKPPVTAARRKAECSTEGNDLGDGKSTEDATMDDPQPSAKDRERSTRAVQRLNGSGSAARSAGLRYSLRRGRKAVDRESS